MGSRKRRTVFRRGHDGKRPIGRKRRGPTWECTNEMEY